MNRKRFQIVIKMFLTVLLSAESELVLIVPQQGHYTMRFYFNIIKLTFKRFISLHCSK